MQGHGEFRDLLRDVEEDEERKQDFTDNPEHVSQAGSAPTTIFSATLPLLPSLAFSPLFLARGWRSGRAAHV